MTNPNPDFKLDLIPDKLEPLLPVTLIYRIYGERIKQIAEIFDNMLKMIIINL